MKQETNQFVDEVFDKVIYDINGDPIMKKWFDSLNASQRVGLEAFSKALIRTAKLPELVPVSDENDPNMSKAVMSFFDSKLIPAPEIKLPTTDLKPVGPMVCSVDDLPKNDEMHEAKKQEFLDEFNKKHPLPSAEEIKEMAPKMPSKEKLHELAQAFEALYDPKHNTTHLGGYDFVCTCHACPEQYDVYKGSYEDGNQVAYIRQRWGHLAVHRVINGVIDWEHFIYEEYSGDGYSGTIDDKEKTFANIINVLNKLSK